MSSPSPEGAASAARGLRIIQVTGPTGAPDPAEFFRRLDDSAFLAAYSWAIDFLVTANAVRRDVPAEFDYTDPHRGTGIIRVEGFTEHELQRVTDWFRVEELGREAGYTNPPRQWLDVRSGRQAFRSPVPTIAFASVLIVATLVVLVLSLLGALPSKGGIWIACLVMLPLFAAILWAPVRRLRWWTRLRARVAETGERMPYGLGVMD